MKVRAKDRSWTFPYLYDGETEAMSRKYGPVATPHVLVFDAERKLRFVGRVDDNENPARATTSDARNAIEAVLAGKPVPVETTKVFGCSVKWSDKRAWVKEGYEKWAQEPVTLETIDEAGVRAQAKNEGGKKLRLINVWATWCGPCVIEFPDLVSVHRIYRGREFEVVTVNADDAGKREKALEFLRTQQASTRNYAFDKGDPYALIEALDPKWQGALPYTLLVRPGGDVVYRYEGAFDTLELKRAIVSVLGREKEHLLPAHLPKPPVGRTVVVGGGKAAASMAKTVEDRWPAGAPLSGLVVTRYQHGLPLERIEVIEASHPLPDGRGAEAASRMLEEIARLTPDDLLLVLISGGGSSLLALPVEGVKLKELRAVTKALLASGASIQEINTVRKHLTRFSGGQVAALSRAPVRALILSDVVGDDPT